MLELARSGEFDAQRRHALGGLPSPLWGGSRPNSLLAPIPLRQRAVIIELSPVGFVRPFGQNAGATDRRSARIIEVPDHELAPRQGAPLVAIQAATLRQRVRAIRHDRPSAKVGCKIGCKIGCRIGCRIGCLGHWLLSPVLWSPRPLQPDRRDANPVIIASICSQLLFVVRRLGASLPEARHDRRRSCRRPFQAHFIGLRAVGSG
jgi:hypothetical protein